MHQAIDNGFICPLVFISSQNIAISFKKSAMGCFLRATVCLQKFAKLSIL